MFHVIRNHRRVDRELVESFAGLELWDVADLAAVGEARGLTEETVAEDDR